MKKLIFWMRPLIFFTSAFLFHHSIAATLNYNLQSPLIGGSNQAALQSAITTASAKVAQSAAKAQAQQLAAQQAAQQAASSPQALFAAALQSQLFMSVATQLSGTIVNSKTAGSFAYGDTYIGYQPVSGGIQVTVSSPTGTTVLTIPRAN